MCHEATSAQAVSRLSPRGNSTGRMWCNKYLHGCAGQVVCVLILLLPPADRMGSWHLAPSLHCPMASHLANAPEVLASGTILSLQLRSSGLWSHGIQEGLGLGEGPYKPLLLWMGYPLPDQDAQGLIKA